MTQQQKPSSLEAGQRAADKLSRIPIKIAPTEEVLRKPDWIRIKLPTTNKVSELKGMLRDHHMVTVCEEASCPNLSECFSHGTATFMIMGGKCTRRCSFCDVAHGRPDPLDENEPANLAETISLMKLKYVVITSVDRDDLRDGGAGHFVACIKAVRAKNPDLKIEILVPDFRGKGRAERALDLLEQAPVEVFNHNIETVPRLYKPVRPGSDYDWSLDLLKSYKERFPNTPTKSGIMVGLGESMDEIKQTLHDLREHNVEMLTIGQYLQPSRHHIAVARYVTPQEFEELRVYAESIGFTHAACGPLVRSSYHADRQAAGDKVS
jgi:lipoic acid synthetase